MENLLRPFSWKEILIVRIPLKPSCIMCSVGCIVDNAKGHCISNLQIRLKCLVVMSERVHLFQRPHFPSPMIQHW